MDAALMNPPALSQATRISLGAALALTLPFALFGCYVSFIVLSHLG